MFSKLSDRDSFGYPNKYRSVSDAGLIFPFNLNPLAIWDANTISGSNDDPIAQWIDSSGNGNTAVQSTEISKPLLKTGGSGINNLNALFFDKSNDYIEAAIISGWATFRDMTWAVVYKSNDTADGTVIAPSGGADAWMSRNDKVLFNLGTSITLTKDTNTNIVISSFKENDTYSVFQNNVSKGSGAFGAINATWYNWTSMNIGTNVNQAGPWWGGLIAYVAIFPTQLTSNERACLYNYLENRYMP